MAPAQSVAPAGERRAEGRLAARGREDRDRRLGEGGGVAARCPRPSRPSRRWRRDARRRRRPGRCARSGMGGAALGRARSTERGVVGVAVGAERRVRPDRGDGDPLAAGRQVLGARQDLDVRRGRARRRPRRVTQWAAVRTTVGAMRVPPQNWPGTGSEPGVTSATIDGQPPAGAGAPPTTCSTIRPPAANAGPQRASDRQGGGGEGDAEGAGAGGHGPHGAVAAGGPGKGDRESPLRRAPGSDCPGGRPSGGRTVSAVTRRLGNQGPEVGPIGLGAMSFAGYYGAAEDDEGLRTIHRALDRGITLIDTAESYGDGRNEELVGRAIAGRRDEVVLATKSSRGAADYLRAPLRGAASPGSAWSASTSTTSTGSTREVPIEESVGAMARLVEDGLVGHVGLSEAGAGDAPPRARGAPDRRPPERVLAAPARAGGRDPPGLPRARHRLRRLQPALARAAHGPHPRAPTTWPTATGAARCPRFQGDRARAQPPGDRPAGGDRRRPRHRPAPRSPSPGCWRRATTSSRSSAPAGASRVDADPRRAARSSWTTRRWPRIDEAAPRGAAAGDRYPESYMPRLGL